MRICHHLVAMTALCLAAPAGADTICEWMQFAEKMLPSSPAATPGLTQVLTGEGDHGQAKVALAMFEAVNAIDRRYRSYVALPLAPAHADQQAAAMVAAARVMLAQPGANKTGIEESLTLALAGIAEGPAKAAGIAAGEAAARAVNAITDLDAAATQTPYRPLTQPGQWVPTALPATRPYMTSYRPWILARRDEVRPAPPPALTSARYAADFNEVKRVGSRTSSTRTPVETLMARYRITSTEMPALRIAADQPGRRMVDNARMFALYAMLGNDLAIASADAKLHYNFWRPITAIRNADRDDNPATEVDPGWEPLMNTPNHGEYPCGHCIWAGANAELFTALMGSKPAWGVRIGSDSLPNAAIQVLPDWNEWARQVSYSRTLGGVHYRFSNEAGEAMGRKLARLTLERVLRPLPKGEMRPAS